MFYKFRLKKIRESYLSILAAILPFAVFGFVLIFGEIPHEWNTPIWFQSLSAPLFLGTVVISAAGFCLGWFKGFPRWTFPYIGLLILFSLFMTRVTTPGFLFDREVIGWRA